MKLLHAAVLSLFAVTLAACHAAPMAPLVRGGAIAAREAGASLYPLEAGMRWEYRLRSRQDGGAVTEKAMSIRVASSKVRGDGATEAVLEREYESWKPPLTRALAFGDKVVLSRLSDPEDGPSITILHLPLVKGDRWPGRPLSGGNREEIEAQGQESVTVPAGTYEAQRVDHHITYANGATDTLSYWYATGVGVVKMIERSTLFQPQGAIHLEVVGDLTAVGGQEQTR